MASRTFHGALTLQDLTDHLVASFHRGELEVQHFGDDDGVTVQIASRQNRQSGGHTSLTITLQPVQDGVLVKMGQQNWMGVAASLGQTALSVLRNPWSILDRLDDLATDFDIISLEKKAWECIEELVRSRGASHQISENLRNVVCPYCETANDSQAENCSSCGAPLGEAQPIACAKCGFINKAGSKFCGQCEHPLTPEAASLPRPSQASVGVVPVQAPSTPTPEPAPQTVEPQVSCRGCGTPHTKGTLFCSVCSRPLPRR